MGSIRTRSQFPWSVDSSIAGRFTYGPYTKNIETALLTWPEKIRQLPIRGNPVVWADIGATVVDDAVPGAVESLFDELKFAPLGVTEQLQGRLVPLGGLWKLMADGGWAPWEPPPGSPLEQQYDELVENIEDNTFAREREESPLAQRLETSVSFEQRQYTEDTEPHLSFVVVTEGHDALVPRARFVVFKKTNGLGTTVVASAGWEDVQRIAAGVLTRERDLVLEWYRSSRFPSDKELAAIGVDVRLPH